MIIVMKSNMKILNNMKSNDNENILIIQPLYNT